MQLKIHQQIIVLNVADLPIIYNTNATLLLIDSNFILFSIRMV